MHEISCTRLDHRATPWARILRDLWRVKLRSRESFDVLKLVAVDRITWNLWGKYDTVTDAALAAEVMKLAPRTRRRMFQIHKDIFGPARGVATVSRALHEEAECAP